ncbi:MAG: hypothetical protein RLZZ591_1836 [Pseudomonadota bacterium]|jgi:two-component system phosphate regulon sensor histidine kinase PhoR
MFLRFFGLLVLQAIGVAAYSLVTRNGLSVDDVLVGASLGSLAWLVIDAARAGRVLRWLRVGDLNEPIFNAGMWGEVSDRVRSLIRHRDQKIKVAEQRLQDFLAAFQASPNGVVLLDSEGRIEWFNQVAGVYFGLESHRDLMQHFGNLVRDPGFAAYYSSGNYRQELVMPGRNSSIARPVQLSVRLHGYGDGRQLLLSRDITALEQAEAMRRDFVANVSHEIRTPLTVLSGFIETLQTIELSRDDAARYLELMGQQADRMQTLVSDLLTLSRLEGAPAPGMSEWVSIPSLLETLQSEGLALSQAIGLNQELVLEDGFAGELAASFREVLSALSNLVSNAVRYTPTGGRITISCSLLADDRVRFAVKDSGPGIAPEHIPRLTERFYRVDQSRSRDTGGTGLGLAIVKHVAQRHGALLEIDSTPGQGSCFSMSFPPSRVRPLG